MVPVKFVTLGPASTNHALVSRRYLEFRGLPVEALSYVASPREGFRVVNGGEADYLILCAVHPDTPHIVGQAFNRIFIVDTFVAPSHSLAVVKRADVEVPTSIGLLSPATLTYVDTSRWGRVVEVPSGTLHDVLNGLLEKEYDAALVYARCVDEYPELLRLEEDIGSPDDAWLVLGRQRTATSGLLACMESPIVGQIRKKIMAHAQGTAA